MRQFGGVTVPSVVRRARREPSRLGRSGGRLWDDLRSVLLDPLPVPKELEVVRRWLRDEVEQRLRAQISRGHATEMVQKACLLAPHLIWKLPHSRAHPPKRFHGCIIAILLPSCMRDLEQKLAVFAFREGL
jgi:hypothetical protein